MSADNHLAYEPDELTLDRYADVLIAFALNNGKGIRPGEVVLLRVPDVAKSLARALQKKVLQAGGHPILRLSATGNFEKDFFEYANEDQLKFFPEAYMKAQADLIDHQIAVIADVDPYELQAIDPQKVLLTSQSVKPYRDWLTAKELLQQFSWTVALWGTQAKAQTVNLSLEEYWQQIIQACYLDDPHPVARWQELNREQQVLKRKITELNIAWVHIEGEDADLHIQIGQEREWKSGSGANIPSFEVFTSPDWRGTHGWIRFNQPLYRFGNVVKDIRLEFKDGQVSDFSAGEGKKMLQQMLETPHGNKIGEFSLTDKRMSRITHLMAEILYDENITNNTHIALGAAYRDCHSGDHSHFTDEDWAELGFNDCALHSDLISTTDRKVTATLADDSELVIYEHGQFTFWNPQDK
jgi:aminopeptidase